ncbi:MAG: prephenate dehydrogenase/arogenate dehydrogenase family protein [Pseudomonadota bacterium]
MFNKVVIFGVGLIGGSFALALKQAGAATKVFGIDRSEQAMLRALQLGIVDEIGSRVEDAMRGADFVLLAAPVAQTGAILASLAPYLEPHTIITDAGSTKGDAAAAAYAALKDRAAQFVPGHPIAGRESNGPDAAVADLFRGKKAVLTPLPENARADVKRVAAAWTACGASVHALSAEEHDRVFAAVSHLPHLLAYALVDDIATRPHANRLFQYAASGFRDFTRIAGSSPEMWRDITLANKGALLGEIDAFMAQMGTLRAKLAAGDGAAIEAVFASAQRARQQWIETIEAAEAPRPQGTDE